MRKIEITYMISGDKNELYLIYITQSKNYISCINKDYSLTNKVSGELYNEILEDLNGEFDDNLANCIDKMVDNVFKEIDK